MAKKNKNAEGGDDLDWSDVDASSLDKNKAYAEYKAASKLTREKREAFEEDFIDRARKSEKIAKDETLIFSHKFGKIAVATVKGDRRAKKEKKTFSL